MIIRRYHIIILTTSVFIFLTKIYIHEEKLPEFTHNKPSTKYVCLTFDDGPHPYYTKKIVDILKEENVKATFFLVGKQVEKHPDLVEYILSYSNAKVANHTYTHKNLTKMSLEEIKEEINKTQKLLLKTSLDKSLKNVIPYVRPPGGNYDEKVFQAIKELGYNLALWSVFPNDLLCKNKQDIIKKIDEQTRSNKEIILLHSGNQITLEALPDIIKLLKNKGYEFINIDEIDYETHNVN